MWHRGKRGMANGRSERSSMFVGPQGRNKNKNHATQHHLHKFIVSNVHPFYPLFGSNNSSVWVRPPFKKHGEKWVCFYPSTRVHLQLVKPLIGRTLLVTCGYIQNIFGGAAGRHHHRKKNNEKMAQAWADVCCSNPGPLLNKAAAYPSQ